VRALCAQRAAATGVDKYIEVSTAQVYAGTSKTPAKEGDAPKPWTNVGKAHLAAEMAVLAVPGLDATVLRLPIVYGPADKSGLMPRLSVGAVYAHTGDKMELLWGEGLRLNTVHVQDVGACLYHLLCSGGRGEVYNLVDKNATTQGTLCRALEQVFPKLKTGYVGSVLSSLAQIKLDELVDEANDGHMAPWDDLCRVSKVGYTPLTPWLDKELLYEHHTALDGSKLEATGFEVSCPNVTAELLTDQLRYWIDLGKFPPLDTI
jgi:nucleoside-diphosphate-sugar epimerase